MFDLTKICITPVTNWSIGNTVMSDDLCMSITHPIEKAIYKGVLQDNHEIAKQLIKLPIDEIKAEIEILNRNARF